jgi:acid phosphatase family membrane protein YuiD
VNSKILSPYLISIVVAWLGAHIVKYIIDFKNGKKWEIKAQLFMSGGMPSSHSATVMAVTTVIGLRDGFGSGLFGLAILCAIIVMYDAMKVRRSAGEQGIAIKKLIKEQKSNVDVPYITMGHTLLEVVAGAMFGLVVGIVVFFSAS